MRRLPILVERVLSDTQVMQTQTGLEFEIGLKKANVKTSCKSGCSACCHHPFLITVSEGILLYRWLVENGQWSKQVRQRAEEVRGKTTGLSFEVWLMSNIPCPLLDPTTNQCTAYAGRPLHCRVTFSTGDPAECHPHRLGVTTPMVPNVSTVVQYTKEARNFLKRVGVFGSLMPLAEALLMGEEIDTGKLTIEESDQQHTRNLHGV
jgi:Fe-S-cluster containining protein